MTDASFCARAGLFLTKLNHYLRTFPSTQIPFMAIQCDTKIGDTVMTNTFHVCDVLICAAVLFVGLVHYEILKRAESVSGWSV